MRVLLFFIAAVALTACTPDHAASPASSTRAASSSSSASWLCRPDLPTDPCRSADLTATELRPDGSRMRVPHHAAEHPAVDCFYVYPTVDLELVPGNHEDLANVRKMKATTIAQAARFTEACALWVPLYRQVTIGTYLQSKPTLEHGLAFAFADIERSFAEYLAQADRSRKIVLVGHGRATRHRPSSMTRRASPRFYERKLTTEMRCSSLRRGSVRPRRGM